MGTLFRRETMKKTSLAFWACLFWGFCFAQEVNFAKQDSLLNSEPARYFEDQLYLNISYNALQGKGKAKDLIKSITAYGISFGIIKDMPINKRRNFGLGLGLGYGYQNYRSNVFNPDFLAQKQTAKITPITLHELQVPLQIRWRTSSAVKYSFWRVYAGVQMNYLFTGGLSDLESALVAPLQWGAILSIGHSFFNMHLRYDFTSFFKGGASANSNNLQINALQVGLVFYGL